MISTITLNPCIDYTMVLPKVASGEFNLATSTRKDVSGKGINVSFVLKQLGEETFASGFSFQENHALLADHLNEYDIPYEFVLLPGSIRLNIKVADESTKEITELNCEGEPVKEMDYQLLAEILEKLAARSSILVFGGRIPKGAPDSIYRSLLKHIRNFKCKTVLDASGQALVQGLEQRPTLIKPNEIEFEQMTGKKTDDLETVAITSRDLIKEKGLEYLCVSLGSRGAILSDARESFFAPPLSIKAVNATGAGDSMVAGLCIGLKEEKSTSDMLRYGMAAAAATVLREGTQLAKAEDVQRLLPTVEIQKI